MINNQASFPLNLSVTFQWPVGQKLFCVSVRSVTSRSSNTWLLSGPTLRHLPWVKSKHGFEAFEEMNTLSSQNYGLKPSPSLPRCLWLLILCVLLAAYMIVQSSDSWEEVGISLESPLQIEHDPNSRSKPVSGMVFSAKFGACLGNWPVLSCGSICYVPALVAGNQRSRRGTLAYLTNTGDSYK